MGGGHFAAGNVDDRKWGKGAEGPKMALVVGVLPLMGSARYAESSSLFQNDTGIFNS